MTVKDVLASLTENERKVLSEMINESRQRVGRARFHELPEEIKRSLERNIK